MALGWLWWRAWAGLVAGDAAALCVAGVALGDIHLHLAWQPRHSAWQMWHNATLTVVLRGRRGTWRHSSAICVAGVALGDIQQHAICVAGVHLETSTLVLRRRRGTHDVVIHHLFAWQAWHLETFICDLRGRCGTW